MIRIDKMLGELGIGTRSEIKKYVQKGRVAVNDRVIKSSDVKVNPETDRITFDGTEVIFSETEYYMLNKPAGIISAVEDRHEKTVVDLIENAVRHDLFPVGRLDRDTEGLLLITNDGDLSHRLLSPKKHVEKEYFAVVSGKVTDKDISVFASGMKVDSELTALPAKLFVCRDDDPELTENIVSEYDMNFCTAVHVIIKEGKFHQIKRMFGAVDKEVLYLKRIRMGSLVLDRTLEPGGYRKLTDEELNALKN